MPSPKVIAREPGSKTQNRAAKTSGKNAAPEQAATPAEAAPTQKEVLRDKPKRRRTLRNEGVEN